MKSGGEGGRGRRRGTEKGEREVGGRKMGEGQYRG